MDDPPITWPPFTWAGFRRGAMLSLPFGASSFVYGIAFGVLASEAGLSAAESAVMSATVFSGTAQIAVVVEAARLLVAKGAEALSGLARAFFYAGARALLVSHWEVDSDATVKLITSAVGAISKNNKVGRAEALRRAMLAMIDKGKPHEAHPAYWAPFVVVGEGAAQR